jgi:hypothetical protein
MAEVKSSSLVGSPLLYTTSEIIQYDATPTSTVSPRLPKRTAGTSVGRSAAPVWIRPIPEVT